MAALRSLRGPDALGSLSFLPDHLGRAVVLAVVGSALVVVSSPGAAHAAPTATVGSTKLGVGAYAGGNNQGVSQQSLDHDGNKSLTGTAGSWSHAPSAVGYQWLRNGKAIGGATSASYKLVGKDQGKKVSVQVTVRAPSHLDGTATSKAKKVKARPKR